MPFAWLSRPSVFMYEVLNALKVQFSAQSSIRDKASSILVTVSFHSYEFYHIIIVYLSTFGYLSVLTKYISKITHSKIRNA